MSGVGNSIFTLGVSDCEELVGLLTGDDGNNSNQRFFKGSYIYLGIYGNL